jgi:lipoprotein-anchoring transpeptidase ErfK/SrfK
MIRPFAAFLLALPSAAAVLAVPVQAQYYQAPPPYYRAAPPPANDGSLPPPGVYGDDDGPGAPPVYRQVQQAPQTAPRGYQSRSLPTPDEEADAIMPPAPGFATPDGRPPVYGHQLDPIPPGGPGASRDPNAVRPPGSIGAPPPGSAQQQAPAQGAAALPPEDQPETGAPKELAPNLRRQLVDYTTKEPAGTIIVDTANTYLYLVLGGGKALRYGVRVGREGFTWTGTERISRMKEWPDWYPPAEMIERQPYLPRFMAGGEGNPLGARAMYLGKTLYRIHGTNQPSTIGHYVSSGCVGMLNADVEDLFSRVQVGTRVVVLPGRSPAEGMANANSDPGTSATRSSVMEEPAGPGPQSVGSGGISSSSLPPAR